MTLKGLTNNRVKIKNQSVYGTLHIQTFILVRFYIMPFEEQPCELNQVAIISDLQVFIVKIER